MKLLVLIGALAACCFAAPTLSGISVDHPTPISPSVLIESRPGDKITRISDVNEISKYKRESSKPLYPTSLPMEELHHITKRDHKPDHKDTSAMNIKMPEPLKLFSPSSSQSAGMHTMAKRSRRGLQTTEKPHMLITHVNEEPVVLDELQKSTTSDHHKRDIPVPNIPKHKHPEISYKVSSEEGTAVKGDSEKMQTKQEHKEELSEQKTNDEVLVEDLSESDLPHKTLNVQHILLPKHGHEFHPQHTNAEIGLAQGSISDTHISTVEVTPETSTGHPVIRPKPVPVAELFARHHDNQDQ